MMTFQKEKATPPSFIFIVPYRDRQAHYERFSKTMHDYLDDPVIYYIHQCDQRPFNRGALKNIGFLVVKTLYPETYSTITLVFNDVDTYPSAKGILTAADYQTTPGTIKHFFGFHFALGGIVSITAGDFERLGGFPNYWSWGFEDNMLERRAKKAGLVIDRSRFSPVTEQTIVQLNGSMTRTVNRGEFERYMTNNPEGIHSIRDVSYTIDPTTQFVHVTYFNTPYVLNPALNRVYDIRSKRPPFAVGYSARKRAPINLVL